MAEYLATETGTESWVIRKPEMIEWSSCTSKEIVFACSHILMGLDLKKLYSGQYVASPKRH